MRSIKKFLVGLLVLTILVIGLYLVLKAKGKNNAFLCRLTGGHWQDKDTNYGDNIKMFIARGCYNSDVMIAR